MQEAGKFDEKKSITLKKNPLPIFFTFSKLNFYNQESKLFLISSNNWKLRLEAAKISFRFHEWQNNLHFLHLHFLVLVVCRIVFGRLSREFQQKKVACFFIIVLLMLLFKCNEKNFLVCDF